MPKVRPFDFPAIFDGQFFTPEQYHCVLGKSVKYLLERRHWDETSDSLSFPPAIPASVKTMCTCFSTFTTIQMSTDNAETRALKHLVGVHPPKKRMTRKLRQKRLTRLYQSLRRELRLKHGQKANWQGVVMFSLTVKRRYLSKGSNA